MSFTLNQVTLLGTLGKDCETRTAGSSTVSSFSIATERSWKDKAGEWKKETDWHNITVWNPSDYIKERLKKGAKVLVTGEMRTDKYEKDGVTHYNTKVVAKQVITLDRKGEAQSESGEQSHQEEERGELQPGTEEDLPF
ncbi:MAG: single-stranded DNA-binding protein [Ignavibacteriaceae bacterium]|jgi:single-strand DNA-binding protein|nr:single-stranded DNA-binding protein [Ignavibacteriaceae bacterium]